MSTPRIVDRAVVEHVHNRLPSGVCAGQLDVYPIPFAAEELGLLDVRDGKSVMQWWSVDETKRGLVRLGEKPDESGEHVAKSSRGCRQRATNRCGGRLGSEESTEDGAGDYGCVGNVDGYHSFLHWDV